MLECPEIACHRGQSSPRVELPFAASVPRNEPQGPVAGLDGRSATARRFRDLVNAFVADMGGLDRCSQIKLGLVRRLAATTVQAEMLEARMVNGEEVNIGSSCARSPRRRSGIATRLGLERRARNVTPSLGQYLAARTAPATGDAASIDAEGTE